MEAWRGLRKAIVVLEEEGGWIMEEDRMMMETDERIMNEGVRRTDVGTRESKDDLEDDENLENDDSGGRGQGDNDEMKSNEMIVVGGAKRKRIEDGLGLGSEQGHYGKGQVPGGWAPSLKMVSRMKQKSSGTFKGTGYNKETIKRRAHHHHHPG